MDHTPPSHAKRRASAPTLADVASHANVSTATVSRCLNEPERVVAETRTRVMAAVVELGYAPNFNARALAARRTNTIGVIIPTMENAIFARGIQAFQEELGSHGFTLLIASSSYSEELEAEQIQTLVARGADALLLIGHHRDTKIVDLLRRRELPTLVAWAFNPAAPLPSIGFDNCEAMAGLGQLVIQYGHRNLGFISAHTAANDRARDRVRGVKLAMSEAGMDPNGLRVIETDYGIECGAKAFKQLMASTPRPSAVLCGNDVLAVGAQRAAKEMGLAVPADVSITGFDDIELALLADPPLTTVHVPHREMGRRAARMLIEMLEGQSVLQSVKLETDIRVRQSLGAAPGIG